MNARVLFILLVVMLLLAFTRRYRRIGLMGSVVLTLLIAWLGIQTTLVSAPPVSQATSASSSVSSAPRIAGLHWLEVQLSGNGAPWHLSGRMQNTSAMTIKAVRLQITRFDCPVIDSPPTDCELIWQGTHTLRMDLPAASTIKVEESFYSHGAAPRVKYMARDAIDITAME